LSGVFARDDDTDNKKGSRANWNDGSIVNICKKDCKRFLFLIMITVVGRGYEKNLNMKNVD
jgi:hypothetical protein